MCRLLAVASLTPRTVAEVLGADQPRVFHDMARLHDDGWGHAWLSGRDPIQSERFVESGLHHRGLHDALGELPTFAHLVHLRFATSGLARTLANTHPFVADGLAFAHNGSLVPPALLDSLIHPDVTVRGSTDSERYFAVIRSALREGVPLENAISGAVTSIRELFPRSSLNALLLTPRFLVAIHASRNARSPWRELRARRPDLVLPEAHDERYFTMHIQRRAGESVAIASSGMDVSEWEELPPDSITSIDLHTLTERLTLID
ncbi:MAG TPA: class II glutamine amidotransferase [Microbacteriaceae bacterium]|nr:class II glutamine amidotransferase [Microbacteriaceae bacterium]